MSRNISADRLMVKKHIDSVFERSETAVRKEILLNLVHIAGTIRNLYTFFEDMEYLSFGQEVMKGLISASNDHKDLSSGFKAIYQTRGQSATLYSHTPVCHSPVPPSFDYCYAQLWLCALRY